MSTEKIKTLETLIPELEVLRKEGRRLATTNGCFDVLHVGHLRYLQAARQIGDVLIVLLNSDASVRRLKGENRPIVPEAERAEMLAGLSCVDYVTFFHDDTPVDTLIKIRPDIHIKGADYTAETLPEAVALEKLGTQLAFIPMVEGRSTTNLIRRIQESQQQTV